MFSKTISFWIFFLFFQYMRCLQRLGEAMKMDRISIDLGVDMTIDALIARAEQLVKLEKDALADRSTHIYNLQRKVKSLKEQLESKDLHIDLLRKKITSLEEKILGKSTIERERDSEILRVRKMEKLIEKYKIQLGDARQEITNLKAELLGSSELRVCIVLLLLFFLCHHFKRGWSYLDLPLSVPLENFHFATMVKKWGHLHPMDTFLVS